MTLSTIPHLKILALLALMAVGLVIVRSLLRRDQSEASKLDLDDLLIDPATNRISKAAAVLMGSFAISSWVIAYMTLTGKLTDVLFAAYLAVYATPAVVKIISDGKPPPDGGK